MYFCCEGDGLGSTVEWADDRSLTEWWGCWVADEAEEERALVQVVIGNCKIPGALWGSVCGRENVCCPTPVRFIRTSYSGNR